MCATEEAEVARVVLSSDIVGCESEERRLRRESSLLVVADSLSMVFMAVAH